MSSKIILVFGSTGIQGRAFIEALSAYNTSTPPQYRIIAITRSPTSGSSTKLAKLPGVELLTSQDAMDNPTKVFNSLDVKKGGVYGVLSIQGYVDDPTMVRQGKAIADAAAAFGVQHFVYSSGDFGGLDNCGIDGYEVKRTVENHIKTLSPMRYTFLKPVQFMENYVPDAPFPLKMGRTVVMRYTFYNHPERKHQLISGRDIGRAGCKAIVDGPDWLNGEVRLAGDEMTVKDIDKVFKEILGHPVTLAPTLLARFVKSFVPILKQMVNFFDNYGYNVDIAALKKEMPELETLREFLIRYKAEKKL